MEEKGNGKEIPAEKEKGEASRGRKWTGTERDSKGSGPLKEKKKIEEKGEQRERKKKCMLGPEQRSERILKQQNLWRKRGNCRKSKGLKGENE